MLRSVRRTSVSLPTTSASHSPGDESRHGSDLQGDVHEQIVRRKHSNRRTCGRDDGRTPHTTRPHVLYCAVDLSALEQHERFPVVASPAVSCDKARVRSSCVQTARWLHISQAFIRYSSLRVRCVLRHIERWPPMRMNADVRWLSHEVSVAASAGEAS